MDTSILNNTKKVLGIALDDDSFDTDVVLQANAAFSILSQLGLGPAEGFSIEDDEAQWSDFIITNNPTVLDLVKTCIFLRVRLAFDPPQTSFLLQALQNQLAEHEWRLSTLREGVDWQSPEPLPDVLDFGGV